MTTCTSAQAFEPPRSYWATAKPAGGGGQVSSWVSFTWFIGLFCVGLYIVGGGGKIIFGYSQIILDYCQKNLFGLQPKKKFLDYSQKKIFDYSQKNFVFGLQPKIIFWTTAKFIFFGLQPNFFFGLQPKQFVAQYDPETVAQYDPEYL